MNNQRQRKQRAKRRTGLRFYSIAFIAVAAAAAIGLLYFVYTPFLPPSAPGTHTAGKAFSSKNTGSSVNLEYLYSPYAILIEKETGNTLAEHNSVQRIYPASLTKIMTAVLAIEHTENLNSTAVLPWNFEKLYEEGASMAGFEPGEEVTYRDLLYGILLPSGAECCMAFAERVSGSEEAFTALMNQKAEELGMKNTHFCNTTGLHDPDHYSTVEDIAILLRYALENQNFRAAFTSSFYTTVSTKQHPQGFTFYSTLFKNLDGTEIQGGEILGGKTGFTDEAGLCLASLAQVNGTEYILVTAKADGTLKTEPFHILDAINVYNRLADK